MLGFVCFLIGYFTGVFVTVLGYIIAENEGEIK